MSDDPGDDSNKWDSFEPYKGPPERELPGWLDRLCKLFFTALGLLLVFAISGSLLVMLTNLPGKRTYTKNLVRHALSETESTVWTKFLVGGGIGLGAAISWWNRPTPKL